MRRLVGAFLSHPSEISFDEENRRRRYEWTRPKKVKWYSVDDALLSSSLPKFTPRYSEIHVPVAIVTGDSDLIISAKENAHRLYEALPKSHLIVLPDTGHQIPFTRPEAVVEAIDPVAQLTTDHYHAMTRDLVILTVKALRCPYVSHDFSAR